MARSRQKPAETRSDRFRPALSPEARENQMISLAIDAAEKQLREGTASSQVITHYLKLASSKDKLERELLEQQVELAKARTEAIQSAKRIEELYSNALAEMSKYNGADTEEPDDPTFLS